MTHSQPWQSGQPEYRKVVMPVLSEKRLLSLLWYVGYCGEFPVSLVRRIGGHPEWNRHVMYDGIQRGFLLLYRVKHRRQTVKSLRISDAGLQYLAENDYERYVLVVTHREETAGSHNNSPERILRRHASATALIMAEHVGAAFLPSEKPSLQNAQPGVEQRIPFDQSFYYSVQELRAGIGEGSNDVSTRTARLLGVIVSGRACFFIYHSGRSRMFWLSGNEENAVTAVRALLYARGFQVEVFPQVVIGQSMSVAVKLSRPRLRNVKNYFSISDFYDSCYFITDDENGEYLLDLLVHPEKQKKLNRQILAPYQLPSGFTRDYDAVDPNVHQPVILGYLCDLQRLININETPYGFQIVPVVICFDYQVAAIQKIVGPTVQVNSIPEVMIN